MEKLLNNENNAEIVSVEKTTEKHYLQELVERLSNLKENDKIVSYIIQEPTKQGFLIKVGGLFGHIDFRYFPIKYRNKEIWKVVSLFFVGLKFYGKIKNLKINPINIELNGKSHLFENLELEFEKLYKAIVVHKSEYVLTIELGNFYDWKYGSILGYVNKLSFREGKSFDIIIVGDEIETYFHKQTFGNAPIFGEIAENVTQAISDIEKYIGTTQKVTVKINVNGNKQFSFGHKLNGEIPIQEIYYGKKSKREIVRIFLQSLETGTEFDCEIVGIIHKKRKFIFKIVDTSLELNF